MKIFLHFNKKSICPICKKNTDKPCILIKISGTEDDKNVECEAVHVDCLDLTIIKGYYGKGNYIIMKF